MIKTYRDPISNNVNLVVEVESFLQGRQFAEAVLQKTITEIAKQVSERYVAEHYAEIVSMIKPEAIATLTMADAAAAVRESIEKKFPDKVVEVVRKETEVWQRGIFGGVTRVR